MNAAPKILVFSVELMDFSPDSFLPLDNVLKTLRSSRNKTEALLVRCIGSEHIFLLINLLKCQKLKSTCSYLQGHLWKDQVNFRFRILRLADCPQLLLVCAEETNSNSSRTFNRTSKVSQCLKLLTFYVRHLQKTL